MIKLLCVDDDDAFVDLIKTALHEPDFHLLLAKNAKEGFSKAKLEDPDIILLDQILPDMPGIEALKLIKNDPAIQMIPVIMFSDFGTEDTKATALKHGAQAYLHKYEIELEQLGIFLQKTLHDKKNR